MNNRPHFIEKGLYAWCEFKEKKGDNKNMFCRDVMQAPLPEGFNKPIFALTTLRHWLKNEEKYCASEEKQESKARRIGIQHPRDGQYPETEHRLAAHI